jgi:hypothetical protein
MPIYAGKKYEATHTEGFALGGLAMIIGLYWAYFHPRWAKADQRVIFMDPQE